ncbi:MAG: hypothetical protein Q7S47_01035 [bacterium]|nr:hypothetical protein [bacterium]
MFCKKISVCHGKTCGPNGASKIKEILESTYGSSGVVIEERTCCGRCENNNSIVLDDSVTISHLSPSTLKEKFIARPLEAIEDAREEDARIREEIDRALDKDILSAIV